MNEKPAILHSIPGRIRFSIPLLSEVNDPALMEAMLGSMVGIKAVKLEPITRTILIQYDCQSIRERDVLRYISLLCQCFEEAARESKNEKQASVKKSLTSIWYSLGKNMRTFVKDKMGMKNFFCILSFILGQFRRRQ